MINNFVGGYAGSGTRVIQMMLQKSGLWVGDKGKLRNTYDTHDTLIDFSRVAVVKRDITQEITDSFLKHVSEFQVGRQNWSIKNGESMWAIPFLHGLFPDATYILTVKNGLDNILNHNPFAEMYFDNFVDSDEQNFWYRRMMFWSKINELALTEGEEYYGTNFLVVKLEHLIEDPIEEGQRIFDHLGLEFKKEYVSFIRSQESIGRHKKSWIEPHGVHVYEPEKHFESIKKLGKEMLVQLGY